MSLNLDRLSKPKQKKRAMVIDGDTLKFALKDHPKDFVNFARTCHSGIHSYPLNCLYVRMPHYNLLIQMSSYL